MQPERTEPGLVWTTPLPALIAAAGGGVVLAVAAVLTTELPGKFLLGVAALVLLGLAALGMRQRPRLSVVPGESPRLVLRTLTGVTEYTRDQILRARVVGYRRLGRKSPMLEIDVDHLGSERLLIFGRWDLGTSPEDVYDAVRTELRLRGDAAR
ncbi:PH domain-containing protein [Nocardia zapadnayensis]|uniref:PH domain-containing protein n=1 Tax=Nocardia rhamnosiphila TaxID=426716 RepID=UPI00224695E7|nr:PH domain-containing protein [Nocardia zapadnayensis]MCX0270296.1 PH domain-containing protein [Nocardia zapadnayensis]